MKDTPTTHNTPEDIREIIDARRAHCKEHTNCSGCPYWEMHSAAECLVVFSIDYQRKKRKGEG